MAEEEKPNSADTSAALTGATLASMQSGISLLTQMKGLLYDMSKNPLTATFAVYQLNKQLETVVGALRRVRDESKAAGGGIKGAFNSQNVTMVSAAVLGVVMNLKTLRQEINQTRLSLYAVRGGDMSGEGGFAAAFGFTKKTLDLQYKYGKEFVQLYMKTVNDIGYRLKYEKDMTASRKEDYLELVAGLSRTGADYSRFISQLQDTFAQYGNTMEMALAETVMLHDMWASGNSVMGNLNDTMETNIRLMTDMGKNMGPHQAMANIQQLNLVARQLKLSPQGMVEMYERNNTLVGQGQEAATARQHLAMFLEPLKNNPVIKAAFKPYTDKGQSMADALGAMQAQDPGKLAAVQQQYARSLLPTTPDGKIDYARASSFQYQSFLKPRVSPGYDVPSMLQLGMSEDIDISKLTPGQSIDAKMKEIADKNLADFAKALDDMIAKAASWQDALDAFFKQFKMMGPMQDVLGTGIDTVLGSGALPMVLGGIAWSMVKKWRTKVPAVAGKVAETAAETASKVTTVAPSYLQDATTTSTSTGALKAAKVAEEVAKQPGILGKIAGTLGRIFKGAGSMSLGFLDQDFMDETNRFSTEFLKKEAERNGVQTPRGTPSSGAQSQNQSGGGSAGQSVNVVVHNYIDGEYVASLMKDAATRQNYVTPRTMNK
jgi:hypothetical protein